MSQVLRGVAKGDPDLRRALHDVLRPARSEGFPALLLAAVRAAHEITGCDWAAVSVLRADGGQEHFVPVGGTDDEVPHIGRLPEVDGPLGPVVTQGRTVRVPEADDAATSPGRALLGVPVMLRGRCAGAVYLAGPTDGAPFTDDDQRAAEVIAAAVSDEIERERTARANARRDRWHTVGADVAREIAEGHWREPMSFVVERVLDIADADRVLVLVPRPEEGTLVVAASTGPPTASWERVTIPAEGSLAAQVLDTRRSIMVNQGDDLSHVRTDLMARLDDVAGMMLAPMIGSRDRIGVLVLMRSTQRPPFADAELGMASMLGSQLAYALELRDLQDRRHRSGLREERDRIARDLHDHVIQRLFALGMSLQTASMAMPPDHAGRLQDGVDEIDDTIRQIRATIYHLTGPLTSEESSLRVRAMRLIEEVEPALGFRPELAVTGAVDFGVEDEAMIDDCVAVLREALTNIARHADATGARVGLTATAHELRVEVSDDGRGIGDTARRSGLANMRARAERRGGTFEIDSVGTSGTSVRWTVPLADMNHLDPPLG